LSPSVLYKNLEIKIIRTITLSVLYECETFVSHTEGGTYAEVFKNRVLRKIFGTKRDMVPEDLGDCIIRSTILSTPHHIFG
jgi:hypothetical protein